jgi:hypothetical protein
MCRYAKDLKVTLMAMAQPDEIGKLQLHLPVDLSTVKIYWCDTAMGHPLLSPPCKEVCRAIANAVSHMKTYFKCETEKVHFPEFFYPKYLKKQSNYKMIKFALLLTFVALGYADPPELILQNARPPATSTFVATTNVGSDNQLCLPQQIKATRVCANSGIWILYTDTNFLSTKGNATIVSTGDGGPQVCLDLPAALDRSVGSYRPAGDPLGAPCSLNLYLDQHYSASELLLTASAPAVPFAFNSAIRNSLNCEWEFFMKENYDGFSECLRGNGVDNQYVADFQKKFGVQPGDVKSIRQGCSKPYSKLNPNHVFTGYD